MLYNEIVWLFQCLKDVDDACRNLHKVDDYHVDVVVDVDVDADVIAEGIIILSA